MPVNLDQGLPAPDLFPVDALRDALVDVLDRDGSAALTYYGPAGSDDMRYGHQGLREVLAQRLAAATGRPFPTDGVLLVNGSTNGLALAARLLLGPDDGAVVEWATYRHTRTFLEACGATVVSTPIDDRGLDVDALAVTLDRLDDAGRPARVVYTIPTFHAPTGTVLPEDRRRALLELAAERSLLVLEDACYEDLWGDEVRPPSLLELDRHGLVIHSNSFSKTIAPGLRLGWLAGPEATIAALAADRRDFAVSQLLARAVERFVRDGGYDRHVALLREAYARKRRLAAAALERHCADRARFRAPEGGFFFWLHLDPRIDVDRLRDELEAADVAVRFGEWFTADDTGRRFVRLSPAQLLDDEIEPAIEALGAALAAATGPPSIPEEP